MAQKPISIAVASDTRAYEKGIKDGVLEPTEKMADALEDAGKAGDRAGEQLEDAMRDAQRSTKDLEEQTDKLHKAIVDGSKGSYRKMADNSEDGYRKAGQAADDFKEEGKASAAELVGSFDGSMDSIAGSAQGMLGGLVSTGGPIALAAAGIGLAAGAFYNQWKAKAEATKARVSEMYDDMLDSGNTFLSEQYKQDQYWAILKDQSEILSLDKAKEYAEKAKVDHHTVALAYAGDIEAMAKLDEGLHAARVDQQEKLATARKNGDQAAQDEAINQITWLDSIIRKEQARSSEINNTADAVSRARTAFTTYGTEAGKQAQAQNEQLGNVYDSLVSIKDAAANMPQPSPMTIKVKTETDTTGIVRKVQKDLDRHTFSVYVNPKTRGGKRAI